MKAFAHYWPFATTKPASQPSPATPPAHTLNCVNSLTCDNCPADALCRDNSIKGKLTSLLTSRQPAIVKAIRAATLLQQT